MINRNEIENDCTFPISIKDKVFLTNMKMNIKETIHISSATLGLAASCFFIKGAFSLTNNDVANWSSRWYDVNEYLINNLVSQRIDFVFGGSLLLVSFILGLLPLLLRLEILEKELFEKWKTLILIFDILIIFIAVSSPVQNYLVKCQVNQVIQLAK